MLIMDLHPTKLTSLLTTSVFVLAIAVCCAAVTDWDPKDIVTITAAYAAVLVVFVGTSNPGGDLSNGKIAGIVAGAVIGLYLVVLALAFTVPSIPKASFDSTRVWLSTPWRRFHPLKSQKTR